MKIGEDSFLYGAFLFGGSGSIRQTAPLVILNGIRSKRLQWSCKPSAVNAFPSMLVSLNPNTIFSPGLRRSFSCPTSVKLSGTSYWAPPYGPAPVQIYSSSDMIALDGRSANAIFLRVIEKGVLLVILSVRNADYVRTMVFSPCVVD